MRTKTRFRKFTAWLLTFAMLFTLMSGFSLTSFAADGTGTDSGNTNVGGGTDTGSGGTGTGGASGTEGDGTAVSYLVPVYENGKIKFDANNDVVFETKTVTDYTVAENIAHKSTITSPDQMPTIGTSGETTWYVINSDIEWANFVLVQGDVHLIICDDVTITSRRGIIVSTGNSLTIYGQESGTGALTAKGANYLSGFFSAAIGGCDITTELTTSGSITINGGKITATGTMQGAAIGGSDRGAGGTITINGGTVDAKGSNNASAIGGGYGGNSGVITINGGNVTATKGTNGSAIGAGAVDYDSEDKSNCVLAKADTISINGGTVVANITSSSSSADPAIGGRFGFDEINISGGHITINHGSSDEIGIGTESLYVMEFDGNINISGGTIVSGSDYDLLIGSQASSTAPKGTVDVVVTGGNINGTFKHTESLTDDGKNPVQKKEFTLTGAADKTPVTAIEGYPTYGLTDVVTDNDKLVIYVPELKDSASVTAGEKLYEKTEDDTYRVAGETILSFDANGGTGTISPMAFVGDETKTLPDSTFERTYYNFTGWNTAADGSGTPYEVGEEFSITEDTTLYAQWEQITYTVTYDANGGTGEMENGIAYASGSKNFTLPECDFTAPAVKVFKGWTIGTSSTVRAPGYEMKITADTTVTAQWTDPVLEVTVDGQTTQHASWDDIIPIVEDKTAYVKILSDHSISSDTYVYAQKLTIDLNGQTITRNKQLYLYYDVEITGTGTIKGTNALLVNENVTMKIGSGVTIQNTKTSGNGISMYDGATLILNGGIITLPDGSSGYHVSSSIDSSVVVVNADGVASIFNAPNVYYNVTPATAPTNSYTSGKIWYRIDNQIVGADVTADEGNITTYDGNTYALAGKTVTVAPQASYTLSDVKYNNADATEANGSYTFAMPAGIVTVTGTAVSSHDHNWKYELGGTDTIKATCTASDCPNTNGGSVTIAAPDSLVYTGSAIEAKVTNTLTTGDTVSVVYTPADKLTEGKPVNVGEYTASITVGGKEISVTYTIKPSYQITASSSNTAGGSVTGGGTYEENASVTLTAAANGGYVFAGWMESGEIVENAGATYTFTAASDRTLVAVFVKLHTITVNLDGGTLTDAATAKIAEYTAQGIAITAANGVLTAKIPDETEIDIKIADGKSYVTKSDFRFVGFKSSDNIEYKTDRKITVSADETYTLLWEEIPSYAVTFNTNGGTSVGGQNVEDGSKITEPDAPTKTGYTFGGWYKEAALTTEWNFESDTVTGETTLYAKWIANTDTPYVVKHWTQNLDAAKAENSDQTDEAIWTLYGTDELTGTTDASLKPDTKTITGFTAPTKQNVTITADGNAVLNYYYTRNKYTLTINSDKGIASYSGNNQYYYGDSVKISATLKSGYKWIEWVASKNGYGSANITYSFNMPATALVLTAKTTSKATVTINTDVQSDNTYDKNAKAFAIKGTDLDTDSFTIKYIGNGTTNYPESITPPTNAGSYDVIITREEDENYKAYSNTIEGGLVISKAQVSVPTVSSKVYTGETLTADISDTAVYTVTKNDGGKTVGQYDVILTLKDNANYKWADGTENAAVTIKFAITNATANVISNLSIEGWTYGETAKTPTASATFGTPSFTYVGTGDTAYAESATPPSNAGTYKVIAKVAGTDNFDGAEGEKAFTIAKATPSYTVPTNLTATYGQTLADVQGLTTRFAFMAENTTPVGNAGNNTFKLKFTPADANNYNVVENIDATVAVAPKEIGIEWGNTEFTYNKTEQKPAATATGLVSGDSCVITVTGGQTDAGNGYTATAQSLSNENYKLPANKTITFNIAKRSVTITGVTIAGSKVYDGDTDASITNYGSVSNVVDGDAVTVDHTSASATYNDKNVGNSKTVTFTDFAITGADAANYELSAQPASATANITAKDIAGAEITLDEALTYNGSELTQTITSATIDGLTITYIVSGNVNTNAGEYTLTIEGYDNFTGTAQKAYTIAKADATLKAAPAAITPLTYNTAEQTLVSAGENAVGGTLMYKLGDGEYSAELPKATNAGIYTVYYKVVGDSNHNDIAQQSFTVTIAEKVVNSAIVLAAPAPNQTPVTSIETDEYTATVTWSPTVEDKFAYSTDYTATITITPKANYTLTGITENGYTIEGAVVTNSADSGVITAVFPKTSSRPSSGGGTSYYTVYFNTNGAGEIESQRIKKGGVVTRPQDPEKEGYTFGGWYTEAALKNEHKFSDEVRRTFTLYAKWNETGSDSDKDSSGHNCPSLRFSDLDITQWYHLDTDYVIENDIFRGITENTFAPGGNITRAMMITVLYRAEGEPTVTGTATFEDVDSNAYYANAVIWGQQNGIIKGYSETEFAPDQSIIREQIAAIMHRYAQHKGYDVSVGENTNILSYDDFDSISEYAIASMQYAVGSGMIKGRTQSTLNPADFATRAEIAAMLHRFIETNK